MLHVFYGGNGVIYAVNPAGDLLWFRHEGKDDGSFNWTDNKEAKALLLIFKQGLPNI